MNGIPGDIPVNLVKTKKKRGGTSNIYSTVAICQDLSSWQHKDKLINVLNLLPFGFQELSHL